MLKSRDPKDNIVRIQPANSLVHSPEKLYQVLISTTNMQQSTVIYTGTIKECYNIAKGFVDAEFNFSIE